MKLLLLGTTGYHPNDRRHTACLMLPEMGIVLDAGTGMFRIRDQITTRWLDIFLSHAHLDHVIGLTFLLDIMHGKEFDRVTIHAAADKLAAIREHLFSPLLFPVLPKCEFRELSPQVALPEGGMLTCFPVEHPGGAVGFRLDWPGHTLAYVTDTTAGRGAAYLKSIRNVDLLVHECYFPDGYEDLATLTGHSCATPVAELARAANVGRLLLVHMNPLSTASDPIGLAGMRAVFPNTELSEDWMEVVF